MTHDDRRSVNEGLERLRKGGVNPAPPADAQPPPPPPSQRVDKMSKKAEIRHTTIRVKRTLKIGGQKVYEKDTEDHLDTRVFEGHPATVAVGKGGTVATADYESGRADVHISVPCYIEEVQEVFRALSSWVSREVEDELNALRDYRDELARKRDHENNGHG